MHSCTNYIRNPHQYFRYIFYTYTQTISQKNKKSGVQLKTKVVKTYGGKMNIQPKIKQMLFSRHWNNKTKLHDQI